MKKLLVLVALAQLNFLQADYSTHPRAQYVVDQLISSHNFSEEEVLEVLKNAQKQQSILCHQSMVSQVMQWQQVAPRHTAAQQSRFLAQTSDQAHTQR